MKTVIASLLLCLSASLAAQDLGKADYRAALKMAEKGNNRGAISTLLKLYKQDPKNLDYSYNLGICYVNMQGNPDSALYYLGRVVRGGAYEEGSPTHLGLLMTQARAYQLAARPQDALDLYDQVEKLDKAKTMQKLIERERRICHNAEQLMQYPLEGKFKNIGLPTNSAWDDFQPVGSANEDTVFFTSRRPGPGARLASDGQYNDHLYYSVRHGNKWDGALWGKPEPFHGILCEGDSLQLNHSLTSIAAETGEAFLEVEGDIWMAAPDGRGGWKPARRLPGSVNSDFYEGGANVTPDGQLMFFWSDAPGGGLGGRDIYLSRRLPGGDWSKRTNLGPGVNTPDDEIAPFYCIHSRELYFASNSDRSMGGYDIMYSLANDSDEFVTSKNMGYPINSAADETMFLPSHDHDRALVVSGRCVTRADSPSLCLYEVEYEHTESEVMAVVCAQMRASDLEKVNIEVCNGGQTIGMVRPNPRTGHAIMILETSNSYELQATSGDVVAYRRFSLKGSDSYHVSKHTIDLDALDFVSAREALRASPVSAEAASDEANEHENRWVCGLRPAETAVAGGTGVNAGTGAPAEGAGYKGTTNAPAAEPGKYVVQVFTLLAPEEPARVKGVDPAELTEYRIGKWYVYTYGSYDTLREAREAAQRIRQTTPYADAYAVMPKPKG